MTNVFIVEAIHWVVPGIPVSVHATRDGANAQAARMVNLLRDWMKLPKTANAKNWRKALAEAQKKREVECGDADEAKDGDVWITKHKVKT